MQWVGKALSSVSQYYKEINPATLSGAIDVIVVERQDEETGETELACSPFHVRFGKLSVLRPVDRKVTVRVNDNEVPFVMKVGETGEAYFVFETEGNVPADLQTSPIAGALSDEDIAQGQSHDALAAHGEPEFLDLNSPGTSSGSSQRIGSSSPETAATSVHPEEDLADPASGTTSFLQNTAAKAAQVVIAPAALVSGIASTARSAAARRGQTNIDADEAGPEENPNAEVGELEEQMKQDLEGDAKADAARKEVGDDVRREARRLQEAREANLSSSTVTDAEMYHDPLSMSQMTKSGTGGSLILDMGGYKVEGDDTNSKGKDIESSLLGQEIKARTLDQGDEIVEFTQGLLRSADMHKSRAGAAMLATASESGLLNDIKSLSLQERERKSSTSDSRPTSRAQSPSPPASIADSTTVGSIQLANHDQFQFRLSSDDIVHTFELSICGGDALGHDVTLDSRTFDAQRLTFTAFRDNKEYISDRNLVVRYKNRYLTWDNASPVLASLAIYHNSLAPMHDLSKEELTQAQTSQSSISERPPGQHSRKWSSWWTKPRSSSNVNTPLPKSQTNSISRPTSPCEMEAARPSSPQPNATKEETYASVETKATESKQSLVEHEGEKHYAKTLRLTSDQLKRLNLKKGMNQISYSISSSYSSSIVKCTSRVFLWESDFKVVISDIDGTITKSDALGHVFTMIGRDWTHLGVAKLYTDIARNGYKLMYLTSRAIGQADMTREYLKGIMQNNFTLPEGPVIMSPDRLVTSLHREVIMRKPEVFKMACLQDINRLFAPHRPFYAGFGNRITDALSYRTVDIPSARIFTIDSNGEVKMELLELAGYKSSYIAMNDLVDQMFPPINRRATPEYTDFNFWRAPMPVVDLPDFTPPSPTLSARSDSSRYSLRRLTNSITRRSSKPELAATADRQRASSPRPTSPLAQPSAIVMEEVDDEFELGSATSDLESEERGSRTRRESMPGSLEPDSDFDYYYSRHRKDERDKRRPQSWGNQDSRVPWPSSREEEDSNYEQQNIEDLDDEEFPLGEMDFSSVPY